MIVRWTPIAREHLQDTKKYLKKVWGNEVTKNFMNQLEYTIELIKSGIVTHQNYKDIEDVRQVLVTKHNYLVYTIYEDKIIILGLINNYKNPDNNYNDIIKNKYR